MISRLNPLQKKLANRKAQKKISIDNLRAACIGSNSLEELADKLDVSCHRVAVYLERYLRKGEKLDISLLVPKEKQGEIEEQFTTLQTASIPRVLEQMHGRVTKGEIRIVRGYLQGRLREQGY